MRGVFSSVEGSMSWRMSNNTEMANSTVTLKLSFSPPDPLMKNEARSRTRK